MHKVICYYCKEVFDRDKYPTFKVNGNRYAHQECAEKYHQRVSQEEEDYQKLEQYIKELFNQTYIPVKIRKQIKDFRQDYGFTYSGILKTLVWFFEIKQNSIEKANEGIGIVPFVYKQAEEYYYRLYLAKVAAENVKNYNTPIKNVSIQSPQAERPPVKLFTFELNEERD